ncbi:unnamed protein product [Caretta caretta]
MEQEEDSRACKTRMLLLEGALSRFLYHPASPLLFPAMHKMSTHVKCRMGRAGMQGTKHRNQHESAQQQQKNLPKCLLDGVATLFCHMQSIRDQKGVAGSVDINMKEHSMYQRVLY